MNLNYHSLSATVPTGLPYRSKQRELRRTVISNVCESFIGLDVLVLGNVVCVAGQDDERMNAFAEADGFNSWADLRDWFAETHGLPFSGILIEW